MLQSITSKPVLYGLVRFVETPLEQAQELHFTQELAEDDLYGDWKIKGFTIEDINEYLYKKGESFGADDVAWVIVLNSNNQQIRFCPTVEESERVLLEYDEGFRKECRCVPWTLRQVVSQLRSLYSNYEFTIVE